MTRVTCHVSLGVVLSLALAGCATPRPLMVIAVPVADLRAQPHTAAQPNVHDPLQESQLLYGERVRVVKRDNGWAQVEAIEQPEYSHHNKWQGYPGWLLEQALIPSQMAWEPNTVVTTKWAQVWRDPYQTRRWGLALPLGTMLYGTDMGGRLWRVRLVDGATGWIAPGDAHALEELYALSPAEQRQRILRNAALLVGDQYYWGGRSPHTSGSGVDCSGLVNLAYRAAGFRLPRDAHEQFLRSKRVDALQPADLIFLSEPSNPKRIVHVMLYAGNGQLIEGPGTGLAIRRMAFAERFGRPLEEVGPGTIVNDQTIFFGSYLP